MYVSPELMPRVKDFEVLEVDAFAVHQPITITIDVADMGQQQITFSKTMSMAKNFADKMDKLVKEEEEKPQEEQRKKEEIRKQELGKLHLIMDEHMDLKLTKKMWRECLQNRQVVDILNSLGVPSQERLMLFDVLDSDENGVLSTSELLSGVQRGPKRVSARGLGS